jgi:hypothetical protein
MRIDTEQLVPNSAAQGITSAASRIIVRASTVPVPQDPNRSATAGQDVTPQQIPELTADLRKDVDGKIHYALLDTQTGKVVSELPPEEARRVGRNIGEFLKAEQARHVHTISTQG